MQPLKFLNIFPQICFLAIQCALVFFPPIALAQHAILLQIQITTKKIIWRLNRRLKMYSLVERNIWLVYCSVLCLYFDNALWKSQQWPLASNNAFGRPGQTELIEIMPESQSIHVPPCVLGKTLFYKLSCVPLPWQMLPSVLVTSSREDEKASGMLKSPNSPVTN